MSHATFDAPLEAHFASAASAPEATQCVLYVAHEDAHTATLLPGASRYDTHVATLADAAAACLRVAPDVVLIELQAATPAANDTEDAGITMARRLRRNAATHTVPLVLLYRQDEYHLRAAAASIGVDDYFALDTPTAEVEARLEALFWRAEVTQRAMQSSGNQQNAIDDFIQMLDAVRVDARHGLTGTLVLVEEAVKANASSPADSDDADAGNRSIEIVYSFLKLNLRRLDTVAFYGPSTLLVYLPRTGTGAARARLAALHDELIDTRFAHDLHFGIASFPADGNDPETLVDAAESDLETARHANSVFARRTPPTPAQAILAAATHNKSAASKPLSFSPSSLLPAAPTSPASRVEETRPENSSRVRILPRRVLLAVSDETRLANLNSLLRNGGFEVRAAFDGQQALDLLRIDNPDLVVIDYELRDMNGVEVLQRLQVQRGKQPPLPTVMLSAESDAEVHYAAAQLGAHNVTLPYQPTELLETLRAAIPA